MTTSHFSKDQYRIASYGDLEVLTLHEMQSAFPDIANANLYSVVGDVPHQQAVFHNEVCFDLFWIRVGELFAEGSHNVLIEGASFNYSLFSAVQWLCNKYEEESRSVRLDEPCRALHAWLDSSPPFEFWCPDLSTQIKLAPTRRELVSFGSNLSKHNLLRLNALLGKLQRLFQRNGYTVPDSHLFGVLDDFLQVLRIRLIHYATHLAELLIRMFSAINRLVIHRFKEGGTNDVRKMKHPPGVTSDSIKNLYGSTLVFRRFAEDRFDRVTPIASEYLKPRH